MPGRANERTEEMVRKNLMHLIRRYPVAVALNFTGLVCAFLAFSLIFLQADYERSFDRCHPTADRVFRADKVGDASLFRNILPRGFADDIIASSAHIEAGCTVLPFFGETFFTVEDGGSGRKGHRRTLVCVSERFIDVFGLRMTEGDGHALERPGTVIIPRSLAETLFPGETACGKLLRTDSKAVLQGTDGLLTVTGVYEDFPSNTQLGNDLYMAVGDLQRGSYGGANFICWLLLDDASAAGTVADTFNAHFDFRQHEGWLTPIELIPLTEVYFRNEGNIYKSGSLPQLLLLIAVAVLILGIGLINFTNFYVALTPLRMQNLTLRKMLGASVLRLRLLVVAEAVIWCLGAFAAAALLLGPVSEVLFSRGVLMQPFSVGRQGGLLLFVGAVALATGVLAGIWPAVYSTSGRPAVTLRGHYGLSESGRRLRNMLVGVQFTVSVALLIFVLFVQRQSRYMRTYPCGYDRDGLAVVEIGGNNSREKSDWLRERLRALPEVEDVAYAMELIGGSDTYSTQSADFGDGSVMLSMMYCTWNFPAVAGIRVTEGRDFREGDYGPILLTQDTKDRGAALEVYEEEFGGNSPVVGFVNELNIMSMRKADAPVGFCVVDPMRGHALPYAYIRLAESAGHAEASEKILAVLDGMDSVSPFEVKFYDTIGKSLYGDEERLRLSVWLFSLLAVLLSLVGIWGQVLMDVQYRRMEIAVKRVFGAENRQIVSEGLRTYLKTMAVCFVVAAPVGWLVVRHYLQQFSHRVGFLPDVFLLALAVVSLLCSAVVLYHYFLTARSDPARTLKKG